MSSRLRVLAIAFVGGSLLAACPLSLGQYSEGRRNCDPDCGTSGMEGGTPEAAGDGLAPPGDAVLQSVQFNSVQPDGSVETATITFPIPQQRGDLNIVVIGWTDPVTVVETVKDSANNSYTKVVATIAPPSLWTASGATQELYYAAEIVKSDSNTVTVQLSQAAPSIDLRVAEFSGVSTSDAVTAGFGALDASADAPVTVETNLVETTHARELLFGAGLDSWKFLDASPGFANVDVTRYGDLIEWQFVTRESSYGATGLMNHHGEWILQFVTFW